MGKPKLWSFPKLWIITWIWENPGWWKFLDDRTWYSWEYSKQSMGPQWKIPTCCLYLFYANLLEAIWEITSNLRIHFFQAFHRHTNKWNMPQTRSRAPKLALEGPVASLYRATRLRQNSPAQNEATPCWMNWFCQWSQPTTVNLPGHKGLLWVIFMCRTFLLYLLGKAQKCVVKGLYGDFPPILTYSLYLFIFFVENVAN